MLTDVREGKASDAIADIMYNCKIEGREIETVPFSLLVQLGSIVNFNVPMLETVFEKIGTPYTAEQFADRLDRAKFWLEQCAPDQVNRLRTTRNFEVWNTLDENEKKPLSCSTLTLQRATTRWTSSTPSFTPSPRPFTAPR